MRRVMILVNTVLQEAARLKRQDAKLHELNLNGLVELDSQHVKYAPASCACDLQI